MTASLLKALRRGSSSIDDDKTQSEPLYSPIAPPASRSHSSSIDSSTLRATMLDELQNDLLHPAQRAAFRRPLFAFPNRTRFLADFTLGFADGLTVPFALTAGLSSLGRTDTVIYAGMAELCAGAISMGVGGYLSARGSVAAAAVEWEDVETTDEEKDIGAEEEEGSVLERYLAPLDLPLELREMISRHVEARPRVVQAITAMSDVVKAPEDRCCSPVLIGLSVSMGYLLGGLLPLFPYFFVSQVGDGLLWSFVVCLVALFVFGSSKDFITSAERRPGRPVLAVEPKRVPWRRIRRSIWEGIQMVLLGGAAAVAAVLCVRMFEGMHVGKT